MTTQVVLDTTSEIIAKLQTLAPEQQQQVLDFVEFIAQKYAVPQEVPKKQRVLGLFKDKIWMSDDFNDPLPDEFWMGEGVI
jgi:mRNA-degrading endonuclease RelE of RelBE toxin-antitoxin system